MKSEEGEIEKQKFNALLNSIKSGNVYFITGKNGSGKSRFFSYATEAIIRESPSQSGELSRLLCFSGTMHDKYPRAIYKSDSKEMNVVYLGNKVNNNMISDIAPFRSLCYHMLRNAFNAEYIRRVTGILVRLNLDQKVEFKFRYAKNRKTEALGSVDHKVEYLFGNIQNDPQTMDLYVEHINAGNIILADMYFFRNHEAYSLAELSSGEKQYILALLGFIFCGSRHSIVFYDEPENSLHPSWQLSIIRELAELASDLHEGSTFVIATHSPLIASSVRNGNVYVCDLPAGQSWHRADLFGRGSDTVLRENFHLFSARSPEVAKIINICLAHIAQNQSGGDEFRVMQGQLRSMNLDLAESDPLHDVVMTILRF